MTASAATPAFNSGSSSRRSTSSWRRPIRPNALSGSSIPRKRARRLRARGASRVRFEALTWVFTSPSYRRAAVPGQVGRQAPLAHQCDARNGRRKRLLARSGPCRCPSAWRWLRPGWRAAMPGSCWCWALVGWWRCCPRPTGRCGASSASPSGRASPQRRSVWPSSGAARALRCSSTPTRPWPRPVTCCRRYAGACWPPPTCRLAWPTCAGANTRAAPINLGVCRPAALG